MEKSLKLIIAFFSVVLVLFVGFFLFKHQSNASNSSGWDYQHPDMWKDMFPKDCAGSKQSPIDITFGDDMVTKQTMEFIWNNYQNPPENMTLTNNGHSVQLDVQWKMNHWIPYLSVEEDSPEYVFSNLHFHWGAHNTEGSEHTINGHGLPLEVHMVHFKREYKTIVNASNYQDGIMVIASFYNVTSKNSTAIQDIINAAEKVRDEGSSAHIDNFLLSDFEVLRDTPSWVSYNGSLTTPRCLEVVTWFLALKPYDMTEDQIKKIRSLKLSHGDDHDNRPTQPLNGRKIFYYEFR
ncbi:hypothetical protein HCN44_000125 [Aphidius gifuensis]|uniref:Alpha-carbonic anhydrase domain-containing protein n=1 Tax=Aphidius gifuensis TaxID=684658 RepID=A0A835CRK6_APHGI|nr:carbonic anhydrase 2-like [Aphidius gifuensis]KAF7990320.1 hypothetical protein HCN44_000125 [Aphidius gifuensis]